MKVGIKVHNEEQILLYENNKNDIDILYMGDEYCFYKMKSVIDTVKKLNIKPKEIYCAIPIIQQIHMDELKEVFDELFSLDTNLNFVVNDLGVLLFLKENYQDKKDYKILLGRLLNKNIESCPWNEHMVRNENSFIKEAMYTNSADSDVLREYLNDYNVIGIESNLSMKQSDSYARIRQKGYLCALDYDFVYVTSSRACIAGCYFDKAVGACEEVCDSKIDVEMSEVRDVFNLRETYHADQEANKAFGKLIVYGNAVLSENNLTLNKTVGRENVDILLFDARRYAKDQQNNFFEIIKTIKNVEG